MPQVDPPPTPPRKRQLATRGSWDRERARKAAQASVLVRQLNAAAKLSPEDVAGQSIADLNLMRDEAMTALRTLSKADPKRLEFLKVLVSIEQTRLDRAVGRPRQVTGQDAPAQLAQYAQQMRAIFSGPADPPPEPIQDDQPVEA